MRFMKMALAACSTLLFVNAAQADLLLEPYLGYTMGTAEQGSDKWDSNNMVLGGRVGYSALVLQAGFDYSIASGAKFKGKDGVADIEGDGSQLYAFVGGDFPLLRAWAGYGMMNEFKVKDGAKLTGSAVKVGAGFTGLPFLSINAEYIMATFDKSDGNSLSDNLKNNTLMLSVSAPFEL